MITTIDFLSLITTIWYCCLTENNTGSVYLSQRRVTFFSRNHIKKRISVSLSTKLTFNFCESERLFWISIYFLFIFIKYISYVWSSIENGVPAFEISNFYQNTLLFYTYASITECECFYVDVWLSVIDSDSDLSDSVATWSQFGRNLVATKSQLTPKWVSFCTVV